jgi:hypothetical protein
MDGAIGHDIEDGQNVEIAAWLLGVVAVMPVWILGVWLR